MPRYIDVEGLLVVPNVRKVTEFDEAGYSMSYLAVPLAAINAASTIDAEPVRHEGNTTFVTTDNLDDYADRIIVRQGNWCKVYYRDSDDTEDGW